MGLFGTKKKDERKERAEERAPSVRSFARADSNDLSHVLVRPRITEKAMLGTDAHVYVFEVARGASKRQIKQAVQKYYNVTPVKVNVVTMPKKHIRNARTGIRGVKGGGRKAYVYLKRGESISVT